MVRPAVAPASQAAAAARISNSSADRVARKRKAQQQQSARIHRAAPAVPMPAAPLGPVSGHDRKRRTPPRRSCDDPAADSRPVSPLLELDAGLRDKRPQVTPSKRPRICGSVAAVTPQQRTPSPRPLTPLGRSRTPTTVDFSHCTLQPKCAGMAVSACAGLMSDPQCTASPRLHRPKPAQKSPAAKGQNSAAILKEDRSKPGPEFPASKRHSVPVRRASDASGDMLSPQRRARSGPSPGKPGSHNPTSSSLVKDSKRPPTPGRIRRHPQTLEPGKNRVPIGCDGARPGNFLCKGPEPTAAAAMMTESQLSLQVCPACCYMANTVLQHSPFE